MFIHNNSEMNESSVGKYTNDNSTLTFDPPPNLKLFIKQFKELTKKKQTLWPLFMDGVQLPQG